MNLSNIFLLATTFLILACSPRTNQNQNQNQNQFTIVADRYLTGNILKSVFDRNELSQDSDAIIRENVSLRPAFFSGACLKIEDEKCPKIKAHNNVLSFTKTKTSTVREGYKIRACAQLSSMPQNVINALNSVGLSVNSEFSTNNLSLLAELFYYSYNSNIDFNKLTVTTAYLSALEKKYGSKYMWGEALMLLCSSAGWQVIH